MTTLAHVPFMRFLGTLQMLLFQVRPTFYPASYLHELKMLEERIVPKKAAHTFTDFTEQVFKLFGGKVTELTFDEICIDLRQVLALLQQTKINPKTNVKSIKQRTFEQVYLDLHHTVRKARNILSAGRGYNVNNIHASTISKNSNR